MNKFFVLSLVCFIASGFLFAFGVYSGEVEVGLVVFIPFIMGRGFYALFGVLLVFLGFVFLMFGQFHGFSLQSSNEHDEKDQGLSKGKTSSFKGGGVVLIGPIPIVIGSNWKIALILMIAAFLIMVTLIFLL